ncbi:1-acyl-sn-glycerol-3-phosphate acyltransferase [Thiospirillum jenense]|uniref:1-acyl-sn-glycerol-3-phosphate acyltransferase n=1 Tax=Thiospirillum jenense TaxID=1653858 RepID=A0A839HD59_9GAMM|nr:lysophospholipid acyltransferase family protein [Thiospirillum jenense]MBB1126885.1 1-acyl-sn-glycerol-3-phosphate acyltransferase [Thiospirillum jenense]
MKQLSRSFITNRWIIWQLIRIGGHLLIALVLALLIALIQKIGRDCLWQSSAMLWWYRRLCRLLQLQITTNGQPAPAALLVANHISWLDIPVLAAQAPVRFLSKAEVRQWPIIGWIAEVIGTQFIARGANQSATVIINLQRQLTAGHSVVIFAEGTTSDGSSIGRFHPRLFAVAQHELSAPQITSAAPPTTHIQPVALRYGSANAPDRIAPFINDDQLFAHLIRILRHPGICATVTFLPSITSAGQSRRALADATHQSIAQHLGLNERPVSFD